MTENEEIPKQEPPDWREGLESLKPPLSLIVDVVKNRVQPKKIHKEPRHECFTIDVGLGPEQGSYVAPETNIGQYRLRIGNKEGMEELLKELEVVGPNFRVEGSQLFLELINKKGGDFEKDALAELVVEIEGKYGATNSLRFQSGFFLEDGKVSGSVSAYGFWRRSFLWRELSPVGFVEKNQGIDFFKKLGAVLASSAVASEPSSTSENNK